MRTARGFCLGFSLAGALGAAVSCAHSGDAPKATGDASAASSNPSSNSPSNPPPNPQWAARMQSLSAALSDLLPIVVSQSKFSDPQNQAKIESDVKAIRSLAHSINAEAAPPNADPSMALFGSLFEDDIDRALESLKSGNKDYARGALKDATSYCVGCHTQTNNGPSYPRLSLDVNEKDLPKFDRAEFYAATRQFDLAIKEFEAVLKDPKLPEKDAFAWERAARSALAIAVRVQKDPAKSIDIVQALLRNRRAPKNVKRPAEQWLASLREWKKERPLREPAKSEDLLARASQLVESAQHAQKYPLDRAQDVTWLRAGSLLHELLGRPNLDGPTQAKALYLAGISSEATRDMNFWTMHETYYELCIRRLPHTESAQKCFDRLNDSVTLGYSGSAGVSIPADVRKRLTKMRELADAKAAPDEAR